MEDVDAFHCRVCNNSAGNQTYRVREMMYGTREEFDYIECAECRCVQIKNIPEDLGKYYPKDYFSFRSYDGFSRNPVRRLIDPLRVRHRFGASNLIGGFVEATTKPLTYIDWVQRAGLGTDARVLDVGCGAGKTLIAMAFGGFRTCHGVDPYIPSDKTYDVGVTIRKISLAEFATSTDQSYDLVMFHHSLEHVVDPLADLRSAARVLARGGTILIQIPVPAYAWEQYRGDWSNLDPPRHLHLFTPGSMKHLGEKAGLRVKAVTNDSTWSQILGSERNRKDIAALERHNIKKMFTRGQLKAFKQLSEQLNAEGRGDILTFYLERNT